MKDISDAVGEEVKFILNHFKSWEHSLIPMLFKGSQAAQLHQDFFFATPAEGWFDLGLSVAIQASKYDA